MAEIGPTVAGQTSYFWPEDLLVPVSLSLAGHPITPSSRETVRQYEAGDLRLNTGAVYYDAPDAGGVRRLNLYPPLPAGLSIELEWVFQGAPLKADEPGAPDEFPEWFHPKLCLFAAANYYEAVEDNPELAEYYRGRAEAAVGELVRFDNERQAGSGVFTVGVVGVTA